MKRLLCPTLFLVMLFVALTACDKVDHDDLAGNWQLTAWDEAGQPVATSGTLYYSFQLGMMQMRFFPGDEATYLAHFSHRGDSIFLNDIILPHEGGLSDEALYPSDFSLLAPYGIPSDGRFGVVTLSDDLLILSRDARRLAFRRY